MTNKVMILAVIFLLGAIALLIAARSQGSDVEGINQYRSPDALQQLIQEKHNDYLLIDVRTPAEYREGFINSAVNLPVDRIGSSPPDIAQDHLIIVYCRTGSRSAQAKRMLENLGFTQVVDFGGINRWPYNLEGGF